MTKSSAISGKMSCFLAGLLLSNGTAFAEIQQNGMTDMQAFQSVFRETVYPDEGNLTSGYDSLNSLYEKLQGMEQRQAAQFMSMLNAVLGRYQDAENNYCTAFPSGRTPGECPLSTATVEPVLDVIATIVRNNTLVMLNESHSIIATRALAVYAHEHERAVPADRVILTGSDDDAMLFLRPGRYWYRVEADGNVRMTQMLTVD